MSDHSINPDLYPAALDAKLENFKSTLDGLNFPQVRCLSQHPVVSVCALNFAFGMRMESPITP